jgi:Serine aminopeptidase, S33
MGQVIKQGEQGYEAVPLPPAGDGGAQHGAGAAVLRRRSARPSRRAVLYVHCLGDAFVSDDLAGWYTDRGFHFYAADLRDIGAQPRMGQDGSRGADDLRECFACLDAAAAHLREADEIDTVVVSAHGGGALIAALWCHARRGASGQHADALVLAGPRLGPGTSWLARARAGREEGVPAARPAPLLAGEQRRLRRGLDIACPVLVMCPASGWDLPEGPGGLLGLRAFRSGRATTRLGEHVTWLKLEGGLPGQAPEPPPARKRFLDELGRWLGAYLSGQVRDQLL